jgi:hypothetical protein
MNATKAIKKLEKIGATVTVSKQTIYAKKEGQRTMEIGVNPDGECVVFSVIHGYDNGKQEFERFFRDNLTQLIKMWNR